MAAPPIRIGIYNEPGGSALGGTELSVAILAETLARAHHVEIVHHRSWLSREALAEFSGTDLSRVHLRLVPNDLNAHGDSHLPWRRYREARAWHEDVSAPYELFVNFTHGVPPFCHARRGVLVVLFPMFTPYHKQTPAQRGAWEVGRRAYAAFEWRRRLASYAAKISISQYTRTWVRAWWDTDSRVIYPPVDVHPTVQAKAPLVLSVGRFTVSGHVKSQLEMAQAFRQGAFAGWRYATVGPVGRQLRDQQYVDAVRAAADGAAIAVETNLARTALHDLYAEAKIFWHAAGLTNPDGHPELNEHFGISTVEAMAAGCVPVVINKGGPAEIVEHGTSGFLWDSLEDLRHFTAKLANDPDLWMQMSQAARRRAETFNRRHYIAHCLQALGLDGA